MVSTSLVWSILIFAVAAFIAIAFYAGGKEDERKGNKPPIIPICVLFAVLFVAIFLLLHFCANYDAIEQEMLRRLNLPIVSRQQLYGYKIVGIRASRGSASKNYFITIEDSLKPLIGDKQILFEDLEISEELFRLLEAEGRFRLLKAEQRFFSE